MRADTQINHRTATVDGSRSSVRNFAFNEMLLVLVILQNVNKKKKEQRVSRTSNIFNRFSLETTKRSNFCFSLVAPSASFSSEG